MQDSKCGHVAGDGAHDQGLVHLRALAHVCMCVYCTCPHLRHVCMLQPHALVHVCVYAAPARVDACVYMRVSTVRVHAFQSVCAFMRAWLNKGTPEPMLQHTYFCELMPCRSADALLGYRRLGSASSAPDGPCKCAHARALRAGRAATLCMQASMLMHKQLMRRPATAPVPPQQQVAGRLEANLVLWNKLMCKHKPPPSGKSLQGLHRASP